MMSGLALQIAFLRWRGRGSDPITRRQSGWIRDTNSIGSGSIGVKGLLELYVAKRVPIKSLTVFPVCFKFG